MEQSDKAEFWRMAWTWTAILVASGAGVLFTEKLVDGATAAIVGGIATTIMAAVWIKRPGDQAGDK